MIILSDKNLQCFGVDCLTKQMFTQEAMTIEDLIQAYIRASNLQKILDPFSIK